MAFQPVVQYKPVGACFRAPLPESATIISKADIPERDAYSGHPGPACSGAGGQVCLCQAAVIRYILTSKIQLNDKVYHGNNGYIQDVFKRTGGDS